MWLHSYAETSHSLAHSPCGRHYLWSLSCICVRVEEAETQRCTGTHQYTGARAQRACFCLFCVALCVQQTLSFVLTCFFFVYFIFYAHYTIQCLVRIDLNVLQPCRAGFVLDENTPQSASSSSSVRLLRMFIYLINAWSHQLSLCSRWRERERDQKPRTNKFAIRTSIVVMRMPYVDLCVA